MHIFFSGIGGTAIGPLALIAHQAGYTVSGSDKQHSQYIDYLAHQGLDSITIGQTTEDIARAHAANPIDWVVYSSAVVIENPDHAEFAFAREHNIRLSKRDELLNAIISDTHKKLIAIAGTHGKTTTTAMAIWLLQQVDVPVSYSVGAKIPFGDMGHFDSNSEYFVYECDEFDRNFLAYSPHTSVITGIDYDHHEIFPTRENYRDAFRQFLGQSEHIVAWSNDMRDNNIQTSEQYTVIHDDDAQIDSLRIVGHVNRRNAWQVIVTVHNLTGQPIEHLTTHMESFPGLSRRFEKIADNLYTDYAHTIPKVEGCLQLAKELSDNVVVVHEPLTDRRQHYIKDDYATLFTGIKKLYWVPSYLAREDASQTVLTPTDLIACMDNAEIAEPAELNNDLHEAIAAHVTAGDLVVCLSGGGGGSLDEWLRAQFKSN